MLSLVLLLAFAKNKSDVGGRSDEGLSIIFTPIKQPIKIEYTKIGFVLEKTVKDKSLK